MEKSFLQNERDGLKHQKAFLVLQAIPISPFHFEEMIFSLQIFPGCNKVAGQRQSNYTRTALFKGKKKSCPHARQGMAKQTSQLHPGQLFYSKEKRIRSMHAFLIQWGCSSSFKTHDSTTIFPDSILVSQGALG